MSTAFHASRHESNLFLCITDLEYLCLRAQWSSLDVDLVTNGQTMAIPSLFLRGVRRLPSHNAPSVAPFFS
jgi:hypothetical protein